MIPRRIRGANAHFGPPRDWDNARDGVCIGLAARVDLSGPRQQVSTAWEPSPAELAALAGGASLVLTVIGPLPPVAFSIEPQEDKPGELRCRNG